MSLTLPTSPDLACCDFWLLPKLKENFRGSHFEDTEMKKVVTRVLDTFNLDNFHRVLTKWLEHYNKCTEVGGSDFEGDYSFVLLLEYMSRNFWNIFRTNWFYPFIFYHEQQGYLLHRVIIDQTRDRYRLIYETVKLIPPNNTAHDSILE